MISFSLIWTSDVLVNGYIKKNLKQAGLDNFNKKSSQILNNMVSGLQNHYLPLNIIYIRWSVLYKYICCNSLHARIGRGISVCLKPRLGKKDYIIDICCFTVETGWIEIRIMCTSGETCLPPDRCFSELAL